MFLSPTACDLILVWCRVFLKRVIITLIQCLERFTTVRVYFFYIFIYSFTTRYRVVTRKLSRRNFSRRVLWRNYCNPPVVTNVSFFFSSLYIFCYLTYLKCCILKTNSLQCSTSCLFQLSFYDISRFYILWTLNSSKHPKTHISFQKLKKKTRPNQLSPQYHLSTSEIFPTLLVLNSSSKNRFYQMKVKLNIYIYEPVTKSSVVTTKINKFNLRYFSLSFK